MAIKIFSDGSADLPKVLLDRWNITLVPLCVHFEREQFSSAIEPKKFYEKMKEEKTLPKTSSPCPDDFYRLFKETPEQDDILVISCSSGLSSTYHHALMARDLLLEESPDRNIEVIDSLTASMGLGLIVYKAAKLAREGLHLQELVQNVKKSVSECGTFFVLETLENVIKGGRLDRVRGAIASVLNIKLLMRANEDGKVEVLEKVRGTPNAIKRLIDKVGEVKHDFEKGVLAIAHSNCEERARELVEMILLHYPFQEVIVSEMGPVIGTYAGEGGLLVAY